MAAIGMWRDHASVISWAKDRIKIESSRRHGYLQYLGCGGIRMVHQKQWLDKVIKAPDDDAAIRSIMIPFVLNQLSHNSDDLEWIKAIALGDSDYSVRKLQCRN